MKKYFLKLYKYNAWANDRVIGAIKRQNVTDEKILSVMGHVVAAQHLWFNRINALPPAPVQLWGVYTLAQVDDMAANANTKWMGFIEANENFDRELTYTNYVGDPYTNNVETIMIHLVNHCSYHRAQVAMLLRQKGFEPVNTDFITYDRVIRGQWKD